MNSIPTIEELAESINSLIVNQQSFQNQIADEFHGLRSRLPPPGFAPLPSAVPATSIKLDIPRFDGTDPMGWIFKINQFFYYHLTPDEQRLRIASFYMDGEALPWFQWMHSNGQILTWTSFLHALETRFAPSQYEDPKGALFKHTQTGSVKDYQGQFEMLANRITGLSPPFYLSCFVSGLKPAIRREVQAFQPLTLNQAINLAKLQEEKLSDHSSHASIPKSQPTVTPTASSSHFRPTMTVHPPKPQPTIKRLSPAELQVRREKGLCYNCDEKYAQGHRCKRIFHLLIVEPEDDVTDASTFQMEVPNSETQVDCTDPAQISLHALMGHSIPQTLRVVGQIHNHSVGVLIDSGSTHNFVQARVVKQLGLVTQPTQSFKVLVENGEQLNYSTICSQVSLFLGPHEFVVDLFVLPLSGAELVLGVQWLKTLGPIITDYEHLTMSFTKNGHPIHLSGVPKPSPQESNIHQLHRLVETNAIDTLLHLQLIVPENPKQEKPQIPQIESILTKFESLFNTPTSLPPTRPVDHKINLPNTANPVSVRPYRYPHFQKNEIELQIKEMLANGLIQPSSSAFSSPVLLVRKKDGSWRFCVDYRALNAITIKDRFPIPAIDELLDELYGTRWFSKLDLRSGYHQIRMAQGDIHKTAFRTHQGHYEFLVMPFGLCNAPSTFQATMNLLFEPFLRQFVIVFFDDILVYSPTLDTHLQHLETVFQCLLDNNFCLKRFKCEFAQQSIDYLGHVVSSEGVGPDPTKISAMIDWPIPTNIKQLRGFLGLTGFYRKFVKGYASLAAPLTTLLKKDVFGWNEQAQAAFESLKHAMSSTPVLRLPNFEERFILETDASGSGMGVVLIQQGHPICYYSKQFCSRLLQASTYVRELCDITSAVKKWRTYLLGNTFVIYTDQRSLRELMTQVIQTPEQQFYLAKLLGYSYEIIYKPGAQNKVADVLSRVHCLVITIPHFEFLEKFKDQLSKDDEFQLLVKQIQDHPKNFPNFKIVDGLVFVKGKLFIPSTSSFKQILLEEFHSSPVGGHSGVHRTFGRLQENVLWNGIRKDVTEFVKSCVVCQQTKPATHSPYGLLQPLPIPDRLHGMPRSIVSDRDPIFLSHFWQELFRLNGTKLRMSSAYHPQSDGQTEIVNKILQQYLHCFVHDKPKLWGQFLHWAEWHYNTAVHTSTGVSPFQVVYGRTPPNIADYIPGATTLQAIEATELERTEVLQLLKKKLLKAQITMKEIADQKRIPHQFKVGDKVFVKLKPYRQNSVEGRRIQKLAKKYYGPFKLVKAIGEVAFQLKLPSTSRIHPVFHVSQLKPCFNDVIPPLDLPLETVGNLPLIRPLAVLDWKLCEKEGVIKVLIQWEGLFPEDGSWEDYEDIKATYPELNLEDKVCFEENRNVMNTATTSNAGGETQTRPKRNTTLPKRFNDYVTTSLKKKDKK
ncbi:hypothetical protein TSUD_08600 [Trifolium subterraneum]|nr:hypothetical protein TSUD_08600 [Trifolium subterraneum]